MPDRYEYRRGEELLVTCVIFHTDGHVEQEQDEQEEQAGQREDKEEDRVMKRRKRKRRYGARSYRITSIQECDTTGGQVCSSNPNNFTTATTNPCCI